MNIYIGGPVDDYSAMRGPCPDGFHVPLISEWQGLKTIMDGLSLTTKDDYINNLHMSFSGDIFGRTGTLNEQGNSGYYWSSSLSNDYSGYVHSFSITSSGPWDGALLMSANGMPIRCFKDSFIVPTSSWTVITGTLGGAGIFWNQTDGLISITSDGATGYTITDKNLGATTVYNNGDTLTQANIGNFYQRGNNYGFSSVSNPSKTSTSQVNAGTYGPGNYYSSDTFIVRSSSPYEWDSSNNKNLRGGVTGVVTKPQEAKNIYLGEGKEYNDMQGPCPDGFHVPLSSEWTSIINAYNGLGLSGPINFSNYLNIPRCGYRNYETSPTSFNNNYFTLWASDVNSDNYQRIRMIYGYSSNLKIATAASAYGIAVRALKNEPVVPDSSWTTVYSGAGTSGIYHNLDLGLISISSDGATWYTIQDKNLGATTVWNNGDAYTASNCGNTYQRGNNYPFPSVMSSDSITISYTPVNASGYGPGNYYESSTWIANNGLWSTSYEKNLRGGVSQGSGKKPNIKEAYVGTTKVYPKYKREPGANTLLYLPLNSTDTYTNKSSSGISTFNYGATFGTYQGVDCGYFSGSDKYILSGAYELNNFTVLAWVYPDTSTGIHYIYYKTGALEFHMGSVYYGGNRAGLGKAVSSNSYNYLQTDNNITLSQWSLYAGTKSGDTYNLYIFSGDTPNKLSATGYDATSSSGNMYVGNNNASGYSWKGGISEFIEESVAWSEQDIINYYNGTKAKYGL